MGKKLTPYKYFIGDNMEWIKDLESNEMIPLEEFERKYGELFDDK